MWEGVVACSAAELDLGGHGRPPKEGVAVVGCEQMSGIYNPARPAGCMKKRHISWGGIEYVFEGGGGQVIASGVVVLTLFGGNCQCSLHVWEPLDAV